MAVYTQLSSSDIETLLLQYQIGSLQNYQEISAGIENTNYFVTTRSANENRSKEWVLTIFENLSLADLPYFCELTCFLASNGFQVPAPLKNEQGAYTFEFQQKVGLIVPRLRGRSLLQPDGEACAEIGKYLAKMHLSLQGFSFTRKVERNVAWMNEQSSQLKGVMPADEFGLLSVYLERYRQYQPELLLCPQGTVHGDLFRDNVLFEAGAVSGVFDFYHACNATLLFDLAVIANDWAIKGQKEAQKMMGHEGTKGDVFRGYDQDKLGRLVAAYQTVRPWTALEKKMWPKCLELAALRFWLSRLISYYLPGYQQASLAGDTLKNPDEMKEILLSLYAPE